MSTDDPIIKNEFASPIVANLFGRFQAGEFTSLTQEDLEAGYGTVTVRNTELTAYRDKAGKVWYFSGTTSNVKKKAGPAVAMTFQLAERR